MAVCDPCTRGDHDLCVDVPDLEVELRFSPCSCCHDPVLVQRDAQITALLVAAQIAFDRGDDEATATALERAQFLLEPWRAVVAARRGKAARPAASDGKAKPFRKFSVVGCGRTTDQEYAAASGEPIEPWMLKKHDSEGK